MIKLKNFWTTMIEYEISFFRTYLNEMEQSLQKKYGELKVKWEDSEQTKFSSDYQDYLMESHDEIQRHFGIFYSSFIISLFSFVEYKFDRICKEFSIRNKSKFILKDIHGRGIHRSRIFMEKVCNFDLPDKKLWKELEKINKVRNCLVHLNGEIDNGNEDLIKYVKQSRKIKIEKNHTTKIKTIKITKEYCSFAIGIIEKYLLILAEKNEKNMWGMI